ncbi:hypothetical protein PYW07_010290 [Mythimna separata]|uniref:ERAP1-like C-terminal domain-containing protein n=1 Tax=Mythimna separata TaxID=271217 RepID=A0AAD7YIE4_MYTSE|nr:hypothetical protein PYW07_010290 [Mythimna separata]
MGDYTQIPVMGRVQLLSDAFALAWTNHLDYNTALSAQVIQLAAADERAEDGRLHADLRHGQGAAAVRRLRAGLDQPSGLQYCAQVIQLAAADERAEDGRLHADPRHGQGAAAVRRLRAGLDQPSGLQYCAQVIQLAAADERAEDGRLHADPRHGQGAAAVRRLRAGLDQPSGLQYCAQVIQLAAADERAEDGRLHADPRHGQGAAAVRRLRAGLDQPSGLQYCAQLLTSALKTGDYTQIPVMGRVQLLSDAFALAWTNHLDYNTALSLASYLQREKDYLPLSTGLKALSKIENVLKRSPDYGAFQKFVRKLIGETYERAGGLATKRIVNGKDLNSVKMQVTTSAWACRMKVPGCEENAMQLFQQWMDTENPDENNPIPLDLRRTVYCVGVSRGSVLHWRFALAREQRANVAAARDALLQALTCTKEVWILAQYLEWTITEGSEVRRQDAGAVIANIVRSPVGYYVAKDFIYERIHDIYNAFKGQGRRVGHIIKILLDQFTTQTELDNFLTWREKNAMYLAESKLSVEQAVEKARVNIDWIARNRRAVVDKLREFSTESSEEDRALRLSLTHDAASTASLHVALALLTLTPLYIV